MLEQRRWQVQHDEGTVYWIPAYCRGLPDRRFGGLEFSTEITGEKLRSFALLAFAICPRAKHRQPDQHNRENARD